MTLETPPNKIIDTLESAVFSHRRLIMGIFLLLTVFMLYSAMQLRVDAGFSKLLPLKHEYMETFMQYRQEFGGANRVLIALIDRDGDIFNKTFFDTLRQVTDEVFFIPGVDRTRVYSLFTPNVRFTEVVEDGIAGGNVIPDDFQPDEEGFTRVRNNILKSNYMGRLVANDFSGAIVSAQLQEINPNTGEKLNYINVAKQLEKKIREKYKGRDIDIHIIGFAKVIGDISAGARRVIMFFGIAFVITLLLVSFYTQSLKLTMIPLSCSLVAVIWQLGLLPLFGFGIDPMSILVPFLIFAIGVSHGVQMVGACRAEIYLGSNAEQAARNSFRRLLIPGSVALASDTIGFITILFIEIRIIQEMAITASLGVAVIILTNLILLPVLLSLLDFDEQYRDKLFARASRLRRFWLWLSYLTEKPTALFSIVVALLLLAAGLWKAADVKIGDLHRGVPELRSDSRYNLDSEVISQRFSIGVDMLTVIAESVKEACIQYDIMKTIDDFHWHVQNVEGVQSVVSLPGIAKRINAGWNEGYPKWQVLPRNQQVLVQSVAYVDTSSGLLNSDCSVMPVLIFTEDHKAETIDRIVKEVKQFESQHGNDHVRFRLATGNVGVMAATNEAVEEVQFTILMYVFSAIIVLCLISFRSFTGMLCVVLPLALVSILAYALMSLLEIGLKVSTLPVVALGVGIGVDYGIYIFSALQGIMKRGKNLQQAYALTLQITGNAVLFTGITLAIGVGTWIFSPLKFQADMGILLTFMFLVNMLGAIILLPSLAAWIYRPAGVTR
ncbi:MAG: MMPL family transporter [Gammaproteobacteria bacterium]|nr:MMPL family transporter [Gammaproteobacteria bacterium]